MTGPLALNRYSPQTWAAVASAAVWKRWALSPAGTVEAEALRGPLIIWAKMTPGEVGDGLRLEAPKPSPLEVRVLSINHWGRVAYFLGPRWRYRRHGLFYREHPTLQRKALKMGVTIRDIDSLINAQRNMFKDMLST